MGRDLPSQQTPNASHLTGVVVHWLAGSMPYELLAETATWDRAVWATLPRVLLRQGIAPHLHVTLPQTPLEPLLPAELRLWLEEQHRLNHARLAYFQEDLHAILAAAQQRDVRVMPLKGSLLALDYYATPGLRPMADIDLLVPPEDFPTLRSLLEELGYSAVIKRVRRPGHHEFRHPRAHTVVSRDGEHPDNPRPVEVHTAQWAIAVGRRTTLDFAPLLWANSSPGTLLGEPIIRPTPVVLLAAVAMHALGNAMRRSARALHWLDLAQLLHHLDPTTLPVQLMALGPQVTVWSYPQLRLAQRAFRGQMDELDLSPLALHVPSVLYDWVEQVPLDASCGLSVLQDGPTAMRQTFAGRLTLLRNEWWAAPWRLAVEYPRWPYALALGALLWEGLRTGYFKVTEKAQ